jgi:hypothetical protein
MNIKFEDIAKNEYDYYHFHDVVVDALDIKERISKEKVIEYFNLIPEHLKLDFMQFGMGDTVTRDNAYVFLQKNILNKAL